MTHTDASEGTPAGDVKPRGESAGRNAGRGLFSITSAKLYFIVSGYAIQLLLPRLLGSPEAFGLFSLALSQVSILNNILIAATVQTVSRHVSQDLPNAAATLRQALWLQLAIGGALSLTLALVAPWFASSVLLDAKLAPLLQLSAVVVFCYSLYAAQVGSLNGRQLFQRQALLDITYTTLRMVGMLGAAALGLGALGASGGMAAAAVAVFSVACASVGLGHGGRPVAWKTWLGFMAPLWIYQLCLSLALQVDLSVLKGTVASLALAAGSSADAAAATASRMAGFYRAAQTFAFVPYQLILSVTFVIFPMVSQAQSSGDVESTRRYVGNTLRFSLAVLLAIAAPVSGAAGGVMRIAYPDAYLAGADALAILAPGMVCFALFVIGATVLSGAGRPQLSASIAMGAVAIVTACNWLFVRSVGLGPNTLRAAACGTALGMALAAAAMGITVFANFRTFIPWRSALRMLISAAIAWSIAHMMPVHNAVFALFALVLSGSSFVILLFLAGEITIADVGRLRTSRRRKLPTPQKV